ncbi:MAG: DNA methylase, partial [Candidatus Melainabacteria bacterium HGW-Melainabacteria-1]
MTGVAAQLCGDVNQVQALGYQVKHHDILNEEGKCFSKIGARIAVLNDLSPAASFISYNTNTPIDPEQFRHAAINLIDDAERECSWMYKTIPVGEKAFTQEICSKLDNISSINEIQKALEPFEGKLATVNYTVWSDIFICSSCGAEICLWDETVDLVENSVKKIFSCSHCSSELKLTKKKVDKLERAWENTYDHGLNKVVRRAKSKLVWVSYTYQKGRRSEKSPDEFDHKLIALIEKLNLDDWFPNTRMPDGEESRRNDDIGITHVHQFYTKRNLTSIAVLDKKILLAKPELKNRLKMLITSILDRMSVRNRYMPQHRGNKNREVVGPLSGTLYVPNFSLEVNPVLYLKNGKLSEIHRALLHITKNYNGVITNQSATSLAQMPDNSVHYIFTDPPFGSVLMYSELNFIYETWLRVHNNNKKEAIENKVQKKDLQAYQHLMTECFKEYERVLMPGHWITVEYHNSHNVVWNAIQEALQMAGLVVSDVRTLDKQKGTTKQLTNANATNQDLIISAYKPTHKL